MISEEHEQKPKRSVSSTIIIAIWFLIPIVVVVGVVKTAKINQSGDTIRWLPINEWRFGGDRKLYCSGPTPRCIMINGKLKDRYKRDTYYGIVAVNHYVDCYMISY